ncbi:MAG: ornithine cyclodeaminase family protein [Dongiaceae bacterium]
MITVSREDVARLLDWPALIDTLRDAFADGFVAPVRHHHTIETGGAAATLLLMPAWRAGEHVGVKIATVFPDNAERSLPAVSASYFLMSAETGAPLAVIEGSELTARRTAAASALASRYLSRKDSARLLMVGTGRLAPNLIAAHCAVRPIERVSIWGRSEARAEALAARLRGEQGIDARAVADLPAALPDTDIVSCATLSRTPLVQGDRLQPGTHVDLVGAFTPQMRETDDETVRRASLFVDTYGGAFAEAGDIVQPLAAKVIGKSSVKAELAELVKGAHRGRAGPEEITLFKSVGAAIEDLAAAILVYRRLTP